MAHFRPPSGPIGPVAPEAHIFNPEHLIRKAANIRRIAKSPTPNLPSNRSNCRPHTVCTVAESESSIMSDEEGQELVTKPFKFVTAGTDARFPNVNQTKHCWQNYVDYHKCIIAKGEDFAPCRQFWLAYRSLCPSGWYQRWDEQREAGNFPVKLDA